MNNGIRKISIIAVIIGIILVISLVALAIFQYFNSPDRYYESLKTIATENNYLKTGDLSECGNVYTEDCYSGLVFIITGGIKNELSAYSVEDETFVSKINNFLDESTNMNPKDALSEIESLISTKNGTLEKNKADLKEIQKVIIKDDFSKYKTATFKIINGWAAIILTPPDVNEADAAGFLLQKEGTKWVVKLGPGTSFTDDDFATLSKNTNPDGNAESIGTNDNQVPQEIVDFFSYGNPDQGEIY